MGYEFAAVERLADKFIKIGHLIQLGQSCFERLLNGGNKYFGDAFRLYNFALRKAAVEESQFVKTYLGSLLCKPFGAVHVFGGSHCDVQMPAP